MRLGVIAVLAVVVASLVATTSPSVATDPTTGVDLVACDANAHQTTVPASTALSLDGPTWIAKDRGLVVDFLHGATTNASIGGVAIASAGSQFSSPVQALDGTWSTEWRGSAAAPGVGAPAAVVFDLALNHLIPDLLVRSGASTAKLMPGPRIHLECTIHSGVPIGAGGGRVAPVSGGVSLTVPPNSVSGSPTITIEPTATTPPPSVGAVVGPDYQFGPNGTTFSPPARVTFPLPNLPPGASVAGVRVASLSNGVWSILPTTVDAVAHTIAASVAHFSVMGPVVVTVPTLQSATPVNLMQLLVSFNKPMSTSGATDIQDGAHYALTGGLVVGGGAASADFTSVTLTLTCATTPCEKFSPGTSSTLTVTGVADRSGNLLASATAPVSVPVDVAMSLDQPGAYTIVLTASRPLDQLTVPNITWDGGGFPGRVTVQGGGGTFCDQSGVADRCLQRVRLTFNAGALPAAGSTHTLSVAGIRDIAGRSTTPASFSVQIPTDTTTPTVSLFSVMAFTQNSGPGTPYLPAHNIRLLFSEPMRVTNDGFPSDQSANMLGNYVLSNDSGGPVLSPSGAPVTITRVAGIKGQNANPLRFQGRLLNTILSGLLAAGNYHIAIASTVADDGGNPLGPTSVGFSVAADTTPPTVVSAASTSSQLFVSFSKPIDASATHAADPASYSSPDPALQAALAGMSATSQGGADRAALYNDAVGSGPFSFDATGITFTYASALAAGTYTLTVSGVTDDFGNVMAPQTLQFAVQ